MISINFSRHDMKRQSIRPNDQHQEGEDDGEKQVEEEEDDSWAPVGVNSTTL